VARLADVRVFNSCDVTSDLLTDLTNMSLYVVMTAVSFMVQIMSVDRLLIAVLLKHHDLGHVAVNLSSSDRQTSTLTAAAPPKCLVDVCKIVHQARTALIKVIALHKLQLCDAPCSFSV